MRSPPYQRWLSPVFARTRSAKCGAASSVISFWTNLQTGRDGRELVLRRGVSAGKTTRPAYQNIRSLSFSFSASARHFPPRDVMLLADRLEQRHQSQDFVMHTQTVRLKLMVKLKKCCRRWSPSQAIFFFSVAFRECRCSLTSG